MNLRRLRTSASRRRIIAIGILVLLLIALGSYILWSRQIWSQYTPSYVAWQTEVKAAADKIVTLPLVTDDDRKTFNTQLNALSVRINEKKVAICNVNPAVQWQSAFMQSLKQARASCQASAAEVSEFNNQLSAIVAFNDDDRKLAEILQNVSRGTEVNEEAWPKQVEAWNGAIRSTRELTPTEDFKPVQQRAVEKMTAVKVAWEGLIAAHQAKDKAKYTAAVAAVGVSYDNLDDITTASEAAVTALAKDLQSRYQAAFK